MEPTKRKFSIGYFVATVLALVLIQSVFLAPHAENLSYSEFKALVKKGKVGNLVLDKQVITGTVAAEGLEGLLPKEKLDGTPSSRPARRSSSTFRRWRSASTARRPRAGSTRRSSSS